MVVMIGWMRMSFFGSGRCRTAVKARTGCVPGTVLAVDSAMLTGCTNDLTAGGVSALRHDIPGRVVAGAALEREAVAGLAHPGVRVTRVVVLRVGDRAATSHWAPSHQNKRSARTHECK